VRITENTYLPRTRVDSDKSKSHHPATAGEPFPRSVRVFYFGFRTSKLVSNFEAPSDYTMLQGVHTDPPSLYLWAFGVLTERWPT
jgi:hypothetical protein